MGLDLQTSGCDIEPNIQQEVKEVFLIVAPIISNLLLSDFKILPIILIHSKDKDFPLLPDVSLTFVKSICLYCWFYILTLCGLLFFACSFHNVSYICHAEYCFN